MLRLKFCASAVCDLAALVQYVVTGGKSPVRVSNEWALLRVVITGLQMHDCSDVTDKQCFLWLFLFSDGLTKLLMIYMSKLW